MCRSYGSLHYAKKSIFWEQFYFVPVIKTILTKGVRVRLPRSLLGMLMVKELCDDQLIAMCQ